MKQRPHGKTIVLLSGLVLSNLLLGKVASAEQLSIKSQQLNILDEQPNTQEAASLTLSLPQALQKTQAKNPELQAYPFYLRQADDEHLQASIRPTLRANLAVENAFGSGEKSSLDSAEITLTLSQTLELGDKRQQRMSYANAERQRLTAEYQISQLDILAETSRRYYSLLALQAENDLFRKRIQLEQQALKVIQQRANAGAVTQADVANMKLRLATSQSQQNNLMSDISIAKSQLAAMWLDEAAFDSVQGNVLRSLDLVDSKNIEQRVSLSIDALPAFRYQVALQRLADNQLALSQANGRRDLNVGVGIRQFESSGDQALTLNVSLPLNFSNPNRGRIAAAQSQQQLSALQVEMKRSQLSIQLQQVQQSLAKEQANAQRIENELLPLANELLSHTKTAYRQGRYSVLQWIDAQHQVFDLEQASINAHRNILNFVLELERITGQPIVRNTNL